MHSHQVFFLLFPTYTNYYPTKSDNTTFCVLTKILHMLQRAKKRLIDLNEFWHIYFLAIFIFGEQNQLKTLKINNFRHKQGEKKRRREHRLNASQPWTND